MPEMSLGKQGLLPTVTGKHNYLIWTRTAALYGYQKCGIYTDHTL